MSYTLIANGDISFVALMIVMLKSAWREPEELLSSFVLIRLLCALFYVHVCVLQYPIPCLRGILSRDFKENSSLSQDPSNSTHAWFAHLELSLKIQEVKVVEI